MKDPTLYPFLSEEGKKEAQLIIENFKEQLAKTATDAIGSLYCNIEKDSWEYFRNKTMYGSVRNALGDVVERKRFAEIKKAIFKEFHEDIIAELDIDIYNENQRLLQENRELKEKVKELINNIEQQGN